MTAVIFCLINLMIIYGIPFNPLDVKGHEISQDLNSINIGGLGIHLIKKMMDDIVYQRFEGKNKIILKKCVETS
jgi:serine/threonine-protein kinase RsbW